jgi:NAD(P)-dependent dehydrogenase (short-subunit alcohol dehydrogenase family)
MSASGLPAGATFDSKVVLVTGGSRGLGLEMVHAFAGLGADVIIASRKLAACEEAAEEVRRRSGRRALAVAFHAGRWDSCDELVDAAYREFGRVDVLINNAGMSPLYPSPEAVTEDLFDKVVAVNLRGPFRLSALIGSRMAAGSGGSIINISSIASEQPRPGEIPYAAAKAGLNAISVAFAHAYGPAVRVNTIVAGPFLTDISDAWDMEAVQKDLDRYAMRRAGRPDEIVGAALYLASDAASYTTGAAIRVDGGHP